ncbi:MAG: sigma-70 family RNA polymerase sigma factor [Lachnospiraceae bacterium]|nr:sigma-70 family RNA polymerase sigma factor [Lachnospiraceae bacterium]
MNNEEIVILIQQGQKEYCTERWERVSKLINMMIGKYAERRILPPDIEKEDLLQCGYFAMLSAVKAYDKDKTFKFNSYLSFHVKNAVNTAINHGKRNTSTVDIKEFSYNKTVSGDDGEETELLELMQDESTLYEYEALELSDIQKHVWEAVAELPERQGEVIRRYYLEGASLTDLAKEKGVAVSNIQQRKNQGLQMLRKNRWLRSFYKEYWSEPYINIQLYFSYWRTSPEKYAIEKDIYDRRQLGEYISYGKEQVIITAAKAECLEQLQEQQHKQRA